MRVYRVVLSHGGYDVQREFKIRRRLLWEHCVSLPTLELAKKYIEEEKDTELNGPKVVWAA